MPCSRRSCAFVRFRVRVGVIEPFFGLLDLCLTERFLC